MKAVLQRVKNASVTIEGEVFSSIEKGMLILLGVEKGDTLKEAKWVCEKIAKLRIFPDEDGKMNLSLKDIEGEALIVSQFTIPANCKKGTRPSFDKSEEPKKANELYEAFIKMMQKEGVETKSGSFGAMMDVALVNDGPVTFIVSKDAN